LGLYLILQLLLGNTPAQPPTVLPRMNFLIHHHTLACMMIWFLTSNFGFDTNLAVHIETFCASHFVQLFNYQVTKELVGGG
jgi:hypothetical protein